MYEYVYVYIYMCVYIYVYIYMFTGVCVYICIYMYMFTGVCIYMYVYMCRHVRIHTFKYICTNPAKLEATTVTRSSPPRLRVQAEAGKPMPAKQGWMDNEEEDDPVGAAWQCYPCLYVFIYSPCRSS